MAPLSYAIAKDALSETDKNRILAVYLSIDNPNAVTDWAQATAAFGCASEESMKVMMRNALKKIKTALGHDVDGATSDKVAKPKPSRKRKAFDDVEDDKAKTKKPRKSAAAKKKQEDVKVEEAAFSDDADFGADADAGKFDSITVNMDGDQKLEPEDD